MTHYFDKTGEDLSDALRLQGRERVEAFERIEGKLVFDCTIAAMMPGFPADLRLNVHETVNRWAVSMLPVNAPPADFETEQEHYRRLVELSEDLHSVFHEVARRCLDGFSDQPDMPMRRIYALGEEEREKLVEGKSLPSQEDPLTAALAEVSSVRRALAIAENRVKGAFVAGAKWRESRGPVLREYEAVDAACDLYPYDGAGTGLPAVWAFDRVLRLSTQHVPSTAPEWGELRVESHEDGWILFVPGGLEESSFHEMAPEWTHLTLRLALKYGCALIHFDSDASLVAELPSWDW